MTNNAILPITVADASRGKTKSTIKFWSIVILVVQNTTLVLMMRQSRTPQVAEGEKVVLYSTTSCVFIMELVKVIMSLAIIFYQKQFSTSAFISTIHTSILGAPIDTLKMLVPATIYAIQNNLLFIALSNLDAAVYQVTYQLKIITTAMFSVFMLRKTLFKHQWLALVFLMGGVTLVQLDNRREEEKEGQNAVKGLLAVLLACFSSGFAGVYFEKVVKAADSNIWIRNIQLGLFGSAFSFLAMLVQEGEFVWTNGILHGYNWLVVGVVFMQAAGGLLVALVVKYADNILKGFATSLSIVLSAVVVTYLTGQFPSLQFVGGTIIVMFSVYLYSLPKKEAK